MKTADVVAKINQGFEGQNGEVETFREKLQIGKFLRARLKNEASIIFEFEEKHIGLFLPLAMFVVVGMESEDGFGGSDICKDISIGGKTFAEILAQIVG